MQILKNLLLYSIYHYYGCNRRKKLGFLTLFSLKSMELENWRPQRPSCSRENFKLSGVCCPLKNGSKAKSAKNRNSGLKPLTLKRLLMNTKLISLATKKLRNNKFHTKTIHFWKESKNICVQFKFYASKFVTRPGVFFLRFLISAIYISMLKWIFWPLKSISGL